VTLTWKRLAAIALGLAALGALVMVSGVISIRASGGHWAVTGWALHFSMRRSVATYSLGTVVPRLDDPSMVRRGAAQYELACATCHGSPARRAPRLPRGMEPPPPYLPPSVSEWSSAELFSIVRHGVKFTGMPAWPAAGRDDEVWSVVAFLKVLPGLDAAGYAALAGDELAAPRGGGSTVIAGCARCHGVDGGGRAGAFPAIAGQRVEYLRAALDAYARGSRHSGVMEPVAAALTAAERASLAEHYAALDEGLRGAAAVDDAASVARGEAIARRGVPADRVPACVACHGPAATERDARYPRLAGQWAGQLETQLALFRLGVRGGGDRAHLMAPVARGITAAQARDVARYYASLGAR
jgi:cytochrome c553